MKSVLLIINGTDFGGTESALSNVALRLKKRGHAVQVLSLKPLGPVGVRLQEGGLAVHTLGMPEKANLLNLLVAIVRLRRWLQHAECDIVHSFLPRANIVSRVANRFSGVRRPHFSSERSTDFNRSRTVCLLNRWTARWSDLVLVVSASVKEVLLQRDRLAPESMALWENGISVQAVDDAPESGIRAELGVNGKTVVFCSVGRLIPDKGYDYLLRAMSQMTSDGVPVRLILVGGGPEEERLRAEAKVCGVGDRVHFAGFRSDVYGILKEVDAFVLSSLEEGVPVVVLEAMACSLPVIATEVGGVPDLVVNGETGFLVPPAERWRDSSNGDARVARSDEATSTASVQALAAAMSELATDPTLRDELGRNGRRRALERFELDAVVSRLEDYYSQVAP